MLVSGSQKAANILYDSGAIMHGHFILSSGLRSDSYFQCAKATINPKQTEILCTEMLNAAKLANIPIETANLVCSPAIGGLIVGYQTAALLGIDFMFCEKTESGMTFRRGFEITEERRVLLVEDVVTTGGSILKSAAEVIKTGAHVIGITCLINRSENIHGKSILGGFPFGYAIEAKANAYYLSELPESLKMIPPIKPGSAKSKTK